MASNEGSHKKYFIPSNLFDTGKVFNGMIPMRNMTDAVVLGAIGFLSLRGIPAFHSASLSTYVLVIGLFGVVGLRGFKNIPISVYLGDVFRWLRRKQVYLYRDSSAFFSTTSAEIALNTPQFGDKLANTIDKIKTSMNNGEEIVYIEGQNFEFATDPDIEALISADAKKLASQKQEQSTEDSASATEEDAVAEQKTDDSVSSFDLSAVAQNIVLKELKEEGENFREEEKEE